MGGSPVTTLGSGFAPSPAADEHPTRPQRRLSPAGLLSGQLSYDRSEHVGEVGAEDEVGEADLLPSPLDFLGGRRRVTRKYGERVRHAKRSRVRVGGAMNGATVSPITGTWSASSTSRMARKSRASRTTSGRGSPGNSAKVTVSATSTASAWAFGPRTAITTGV
jgi:hypothetical protein